MGVEQSDLSKREFWKLTDRQRTLTGYEADTNLAFIGTADLPTLMDICLQYRFFTKYFSDDLAILVYRSPPGHFKSELAAILSDELGGGDSNEAHLQLYDAFLASIGVKGSSAELDKRGAPEIIAILEELRDLTQHESFFYAVGLRGMGGECLCQIYLEVMAARLHANPAIRPISDQVQWRFWDIHAGAEDQEHRDRTRAVIDEIVGDNVENLKALEDGYFKAKSAFDQFWKIAHQNVTEKLAS